MNLNIWIKSARLRTLPLSLSAVVLGICFGFYNLRVRGITFTYVHVLDAVFILLTAVSLQIISNYANDLGDLLSGVDNKERKGPIRGMQSGLISIKMMKKAIVYLSIFSLITGCLSICLAFMNDLNSFCFFIILGFLSLFSAVTYTIGLKYGYKGYGDLFVFVFFGIVAVIGSEYMIAKTYSGLLLAINAGIMAIMVLNVNNLRDYETDKKTLKKSIVVMIGLKNGKRYHFLLLFLSVLSIVCYIGYSNILSNNSNYYVYVVLSVIFYLPLLCSSIFCIDKKHKNEDLNPKLKTTSIGASFVNIFNGVFLLFL
ncbi:MAG: 1,4-dihydroxy-2-naphthoate octaprenyltransferase [Succinivibrionaceae bacterium]